MNAKLLVVIGKTTKKETALQLPAVLGRSREADITVAHPLISRRHCELFEDNGLLMLRDLASLNGTMIGGRGILLAPLLPDAEFTIGPVTFRVLYEYDGDLEVVPDTCFAADVEGVTEAAEGDPTTAGMEESPNFGVDEALLAEPADAGHSGELAMPNFMDLADAEPDEVFPAAAPPPRQLPSRSPTGPQWPPVADDRLPTVPLNSALDEPLEVDSSLQSGGHNSRESPWAAEPPLLSEPQGAPRIFAGKEPPADPEPPPEATSSEKAAKQPVRPKPQAPSPPKNPTYGEEIDPEFGSFLEGLE